MERSKKEINPADRSDRRRRKRRVERARECARPPSDFKLNDNRLVSQHRRISILLSYRPLRTCAWRHGVTPRNATVRSDWLCPHSSFVKRFAAAVSQVIANRCDRLRRICSCTARMATDQARIASRASRIRVRREVCRFPTPVPVHALQIQVGGERA